jgi:hypothetical protein
MMHDFNGDIELWKFEYIYKYEFILPCDLHEFIEKWVLIENAFQKERGL